MHNPHLVSVDEVLEEELTEIAKRRDYLRSTGQQVEQRPQGENGSLSRPAMSESLVGLALSGGGVRSASFCLGVVQAFYRRGILKYVDYISSVSGGGYTAAFLSTLVKNTERPIDWTAEKAPAADDKKHDEGTHTAAEPRAEVRPDRLPITGGANGLQPPLIQQLGNRMPRMGRPLRFVARLAWGVITINALLLSGLVMVAALVAYLMRLTDDRVARVYLQELGFQTDMGVAFFPAFLFFLLWTGAHIASVLFPTTKDKWRKVATLLFVIMVVCLLLGIATVLGTGDLDLIWLERNWGVSRTMTDTIRKIAGFISTLLAAVFAASFLPYLRITQLIQSGTRTDAKPYEKAIYKVVSHVLILGTPLVVYYVLAKENISGYQETRSDRTALVPSAVKDWIGFVRKLRSDANLTDYFDKAAVTEPRYLVASPKPETPNSKPNLADHIWRSAIPTEADKAWDLQDSLPSASQDRQGIPKRPLETILTHEDQVSERHRSQWMLRSWLSLLMSPVVPTYRDYVADGLYVNGVREWTVGEINRHALSNPTLFRIEPSPIASPRPESVSSPESKSGGKAGESANASLPNPQAAIPAAVAVDEAARKEHALWQANQAQGERLFKKFKDLVKQDDRSSDSRGASKASRAAGQSSGVVAADTEVDPRWGNDPGGYLTDQVAALRAEMAVAEHWNSRRREWAVRRGQENLTRLETRLKRWEEVLDSVRRNNIQMLKRHFPDVGIEEPESTVFSYVVYSADQRTRLSYVLWAGGVFLIIGLLINLNSTSMHGFFRDQLAEIWTPTGADEPLAGLRVCEKGAAFPVWSAALNRLVRRVDADDQKMSLFQFTPRFCGAGWLGFVPTSRFQKGTTTVGEAMALSGAALTPAVGDNLLLRMFLMITNFRMGQWVPTPSLSPTDSARAFPLRLLWNRLFFPMQQRSLCFLTDGGFAENIGVAPLLQRRCRLIIAIDGSCDPDSQFLDLAKLMRMSESRYGVKFTSIKDADQPVDLTPVRPDSGRCPAHVVVARIQYPAPRQPVNSPRASEGYFVYIKPSFTGDESAHLMLYREDRKQFPHEATVDQFFDSDRFEAYRLLGEHIGDAVWRDLWRRGDGGVAAALDPAPTRNLWTWKPVPPFQQEVDAKSPVHEGMLRALRSLDSPRVSDREKAIAWLGDHLPEMKEETQQQVLVALRRAHGVEADSYIKKLIEKAIDQIDNEWASKRKGTKKRKE